MNPSVLSKQVPPSLLPRLLASTAARAGGFTVVFLVAALAGRATRLPGSEVSMVWPAAAVAVLWLLAARSRREALLSVVLLALTASTASYLTGLDAELSVAFALVNVVTGAGTAWLLRLHGPVRLRELSDLGWVLASVLAATGVSAVLGGLTLHLAEGAPLWRSTAVFWLRNGVTVLLGVALLATAPHARGWRWPARRRLVGDVVVWLLAVAVHLVVFVVNDGLPLSYFALPVAVMVGLRWSTAVVVGHLLASDVFVLVATAAGRGPFSGGEPVLQAALAQGLIGCSLLVALTVALYRDSRETLLRELDEAHQRTRAAADRLRHASLHDPLTGLANRQRLFDLLTEEIAAQPGGSGLGVVFLDLDGFKSVNDTWGHAEGDLLLRAVADRLRETARVEDAVARLGGDEFVVVCRRIDEPGLLDQVAARVAAELARPYRLASGGVHEGVSASTGTAWARPSTTAALLVAEADAAMYAAKRDRRRQAEEPALT